MSNKKISIYSSRLQNSGGKSSERKFKIYQTRCNGCKSDRKLMADLPQLDKDRIDDLIVGNAMPEAEQGLNVARLISLMGLNNDKSSRSYQ